MRDWASWKATSEGSRRVSPPHFRTGFLFNLDAEWNGCRQPNRLRGRTLQSRSPSSSKSIPIRHLFATDSKPSLRAWITLSWITLSWITWHGSLKSRSKRCRSWITILGTSFCSWLAFLDRPKRWRDGCRPRRAPRRSQQSLFTLPCAPTFGSCCFTGSRPARSTIVRSSTYSVPTGSDDARPATAATATKTLGPTICYGSTCFGGFKFAILLQSFVGAFPRRDYRSRS